MSMYPQVGNPIVVSRPSNVGRAVVLTGPPATPTTVFRPLNVESTRCAQRPSCEALKAAGVEAELWRYPDRTTAMGQMINSYLQSKTEMDDGAIHLLFSANRWVGLCKLKLVETNLESAWFLCLNLNNKLLSNVAFNVNLRRYRWEKRALMEEKLKAGVTLVVDRYSYSGVAFTAAKKSPGLDLDWCKAGPYTHCTVHGLNVNIPLSESTCQLDCQPYTTYPIQHTAGCP